MTEATSNIRLSPRQLEIARLIATGRDTGEIARELEISPEAAKMHVNRIADQIERLHGNPGEITPLRLVRRWAVQQDWLRSA